MSLKTIQELNIETKQVNYLDGELEIPANHNWVALVKVNVPGGVKIMIASFEEEPTTSRSGNYVPKPGTGCNLLLEVANESTEGTLRQVDGFTNPMPVLAANIEELANKLTNAFNQAESSEELVHTVLCPEHGILPDFLKHSLPMIKEVFADDDESEDADEDELPADLKKALQSPLLGALVAVALAKKASQEEQAK